MILDLDMNPIKSFDSETEVQSSTWDILGVAIEYPIKESLDNYEDLIDFYFTDNEEEENINSIQDQISTPRNNKRKDQTQDITDNLHKSSIHKRRRTDTGSKSKELNIPDFAEIQTTTNISKKVANHEYPDDLQVLTKETKVEEWIAYARNIIHKK